MTGTTGMSLVTCGVFGFFHRFHSRMALHSQKCESLNCPEENDETLSEELHSGLFTRFQKPKTSQDRSISPHGMMEWQLFGLQHAPTNHELSQPLHDQLCRSNPQAPYPSQDTTDRLDPGPLHAWHYLSYPSRSPGGSCPSSLPSYLPSVDFRSYPGSDSYFPNGPHSLPSTYSPSLGSMELPGSLHSFPSAVHPVHSHHSPPFFGHHHSQPCCLHYGPVPLQIGPLHHPTLRPRYHVAHSRLTGPEHFRHAHTGNAANGHDASHPGQTSPCTTQLSQNQRKVFVTYEADNEEHLKEVIKFVALLRSNGFDTHIDVFEQQLNSISKIDCMERYLNEKDYLIIIIISLKYFETVTGAKRSLDCDERTSNTVYIHKQLQSEFIQNGCKNFRFIPVLFPGAKKSYVPSWLQNTHLYRWPRDRDDILRRLMRVEKYRPPPVGPLPTIVSVPI